jgi:hypothetical protein
MHGPGNAGALPRRGGFAGEASPLALALGWHPPPAWPSCTSPYNGIATLADYVGAILPPALLFASALPWSRWWTLRAPDEKIGIHDIFDALSAGVRSVTAGFLLAAGSFDYLDDILPITLFLAASSAILVTGSLLLRARTWEIPAAVYMIGAFACLGAPALPRTPAWH